MKNASTLCIEFILHVTDTEITSNAKRFSTFTEQFNYLCALHTFGQKKSNEKMNKKPPTHESVLLLFTSAVRFFVRRLCLTFRQSIKLKAFPTYSVRAKRYRISVFIVNILFSRRIIRDPLNCSDAFIDRLHRFFFAHCPSLPLCLCYALQSAHNQFIERYLDFGYISFVIRFVRVGLFCLLCSLACVSFGVRYVNFNHLPTPCTTYTCFTPKWLFACMFSFIYFYFAVFSSVVSTSFVSFIFLRTI